jgi:YHS domain-containing protein
MRQLLFLALFVALGYLLAQLIALKRRTPRAPEPRQPTGVTEEMVRDPYCQIYLPRSQAIRGKVRGQEHFFCSPGCLEKFLASGA